MSAEVSASIVLGATIDLKEFDAYLVEVEAKTHAAKRYSQTTGKRLKDALVVDQQPAWGYKFDEKNEALTVSHPFGRDIRQLDGFLEALHGFLELEVSFVNDGDSVTEVLVGEAIGSEVSCDAYACFALVGSPYTDLSTLTKRANRIKKVLKAKLGITPVVGLIAALDIND